MVWRSRPVTSMPKSMVEFGGVEMGWVWNPVLDGMVGSWGFGLDNVYVAGLRNVLGAASKSVAGRDSGIKLSLQRSYILLVLPESV